MCGIAGYQGDFDRGLLSRMRSLLSHRGPDDSGEWCDPNNHTGLAHTRLSIIDISPGGHQPMSVRNGALQITFNGEIYNYRELRERLVAGGRRFVSESDTEVLLALYEKYGRDLFSHLNGIFSFALWDDNDRSLFVARDHMGIKPLYYAETEDGFLFASELKALLLNQKVDREIDTIALDQFMAFGWAIAPRTILKGVRQLPPGHAMTVRDGRVERIWQYYDVPYRAESSPESEAVLIEKLQDGVRSAVERQMVSDVPVGAFLSGGLDSSAVVAMMRKVRPEHRPICYSIGFEDNIDLDGSPSDLPFAERAADALGADLRPIVVDSTLADHLETMLYHLDGPYVDPAPLNALVIAKQAREDGMKVLLSGTGGDDIFSGYRRHLAMSLESYWSWLPRPFRGAISGASQRIGPRRFRRAFQYAGMNEEDRLLSYFLWSSDRVRHGLMSEDVVADLAGYDTLSPLRESAAKLAPGVSRLDRMLYLETKHFLADHNLNYMDKMGMAHGVEVRVPLIDIELVEFATSIPARLKQHGKTGKYLFKKAMEPYLPREVIYRPKTGFGVPLRRWMRNELSPLVDDILTEDRVRRRGLFEPSAVRRLITDTRSGAFDGAYTVFGLLAVELWCTRLLDHSLT